MLMVPDQFKGEILMLKKTAVRVFIGAFFIAGVLASSFAQMPNPYGTPISLENAKKAAAPALAEAEKNHWNMAVAIVDPSGNLVYYEKMDNTQLGSASVAIDKARSAALFKRPTKAFQDAVAAGGEGLRILRLQGATPLEGGIPLLMDGKIVGAIGVSGATSAQDAQCAKAGADAIK
jgi:glc operon protein GlcG